MPYKSDLTGKIIQDESQMIAVQFMESGELVTRYLANLQELKDWWLVGKPHKGGEVEMSSFHHESIEDESQKITVRFRDQTFIFRDLAEAKAWYAEIIK